MMTRQSQLDLLAIAREAIVEQLSKTGSAAFTRVDTLPPAELCGAEGAFVTLKQRGLSPSAAGSLRGCIGNIIGKPPLYRLVQRLACESAFHDPRFSPVRLQEMSQLRLEISVLTVPVPVQSFQEIEVGRDGVILTNGYHRAVFLPQVATEQGWSREEMLSHLAMKAGLYPSAWQQTTTTFEVFQAEVFQEE